MGRPPKEGCDWFKHDRDMRNDPKVLALRTRFGMDGYGVWCMILESLSDAANFRLEWTEDSRELLAGDYRIDAEKLGEIAAYMQRIKLLEIADGFLFCPKLTERLKTLIDKREREQERYAGKVSAAESDFPTAGSTQIRVDKSRVDKSNIVDVVVARTREAENGQPEKLAKAMLQAAEEEGQLQGAAAFDLSLELASMAGDESLRQSFAVSRQIPEPLFVSYLERFSAEARGRASPYADAAALRLHFLNLSQKRYRDEQKPSEGRSFRSGKPTTVNTKRISPDKFSNHASGQRLTRKTTQ